jgi:hypothetical protein
MIPISSYNTRILNEANRPDFFHPTDGGVVFRGVEVRFRVSPLVAGRAENDDVLLLASSMATLSSQLLGAGQCRGHIRWSSSC